MENSFEIKVRRMSLPKKLKELISRIGRHQVSSKVRPTYVRLVVCCEYPVINIDAFSFCGAASDAIMEVLTTSRGSYMGDDGEPYYETLTRFKGIVAYAFGYTKKHVTVTLTVKEDRFAEFNEARKKFIDDPAVEGISIPDDIMKVMLNAADEMTEKEVIP